jgi:hypothetical protein
MRRKRPGSPLVQHGAYLWPPSPVVGSWLSQKVLELVLWGLAARSAACSPRACLNAFSPLLSFSSRIVIVGSSIPSVDALRGSVLTWSSKSAG